MKIENLINEVGELKEVMELLRDEQQSASQKKVANSRIRRWAKAYLAKKEVSSVVDFGSRESIDELDNDLRNAIAKRLKSRHDQESVARSAARVMVILPLRKPALTTFVRLKRRRKR